MFYLLLKDCKLLNAKKGHHVGMSDNSAKEVVKLIEDGVLKPLTPEESNKIYKEQANDKL
jgi:hypothetical protein